MGHTRKWSRKSGPLWHYRGTPALWFVSSTRPSNSRTAGPHRRRLSTPTRRRRTSQRRTRTGPCERRLARWCSSPGSESACRAQRRRLFSSPTAAPETPTLCSAQTPRVEKFGDDVRIGRERAASRRRPVSASVVQTDSTQRPNEASTTQGCRAATLSSFTSASRPKCVAASGNGRQGLRASQYQFDDDEPLWLAVVREFAVSVKNFVVFLAEQPRQLRHLEWPGFQNTLRTAALTLILVVVFIVALSSVDTALSYILSWLLRKSA